MAETSAIDFTYPTSYSTSIPFCRSVGIHSGRSNGSNTVLRAQPTKFRFCFFFIFDHPLKKSEQTSAV